MAGEFSRRSHVYSAFMIIRVGLALPLVAYVLTRSLVPRCSTLRAPLFGGTSRPIGRHDVSESCCESPDVIKVELVFLYGRTIGIG